MINLTIKINDKSAEGKDKRLSRFVCLYSLFGMLNTAIKVVFPLSEKAWTMLSMSFVIILLLFLMSCFTSIIIRKGQMFFVSEACALLVYLLSFLLDNANTSLLLSNFFQTTAVAIPIACATISIDDKKILYNYFIRYGYLCGLLSFAFWIFATGQSSAESYNMSFTGYYLIFLLVQWNELIVGDRKKVVIAFFALYGLLFVFLSGNRGGLICVLFFIIIRGIKVVNVSTKRKVYTIGIGVPTLLIVIIFFNYIVEWIHDYLNSIGKASYIVTRLMNGDFFESDARIQLFTYYWKLIKEKPLMGWGIYGGFIGEGEGPHNGIIELVLAFGLFLGGAITLFIFFSLIKTVMLKPIANAHYDILIIFAASIIMKFISAGNIMISANLFTFLFLCWGKELRELYKRQCEEKESCGERGNETIKKSISQIT